jgi:archaellum component FlaC
MAKEVATPEVELEPIKAEISDIKQAIEVLADQVAVFNARLEEASKPRETLPEEFTHGITLDKVFYAALEGCIASTLSNGNLARIIDREPLCRSQARQMITFARIVTEEFAKIAGK